MANVNDNTDMFTLRSEYANCVYLFTFPEDYMTEAKKLAAEQTPVLDLITDEVLNKMTATLAQETFAKAIVPAQVKPMFEMMSKRTMGYLEVTKLSVQDYDRRDKHAGTEKDIPRLISLIQNNKLYRYKMVQVLHTLNELHSQKMIPFVPSDQKEFTPAALLLAARPLYNDVTATALKVLMPIFEEAAKKMPEMKEPPLSKEELDKAVTRIATAFENTKNVSKKIITNVQV